MGDEMNLCAEMHSLLASIQDKAARLGRRISLLELQQRVDRLRRRLEVLEAAHQVGDGEDHFGEDADEDGGSANVFAESAAEVDFDNDGDFDFSAQEAAQEHEHPDAQPGTHKEADDNMFFDRCGTWGCLLTDRHSGLHSFAAPEGRRPRIPVLPIEKLPRTVPQQPNLAARQAALAAIHRAELAAEAEAEGLGDAEAEVPAEAENPVEVVAPGFTDSMRVTKLRADYAAWLVAIGKKAGVRGGSQFAQKFIVSLDHETPCLSDSRLSLMSTYRESGLTRVQLMPNGADSYSKVERFQYLVEQQPDCMDMDGDAVHGRWFWPIDHAWIFGEPDKPQGWTTSLLSIVAIRLRSMILSDHVRLITGICDNPQPAGCYINYADWIRMWNKSYGFCPFCNRDIWIGFDEECNDEDIPPEGQKATIQRLKNSIIHLRSNCHATLICLDCNSNDPTRYDAHLS